MLIQKLFESFAALPICPIVETDTILVTFLNNPFIYGTLRVQWGNAKGAYFELFYTENEVRFAKVTCFNRCTTSIVL